MLHSRYTFSTGSATSVTLQVLCSTTEVSSRRPGFADVIRHMSKYGKYDIITEQFFLKKMYKHHKPTFWVLAPTQHMSDGTIMLKLSFSLGPALMFPCISTTIIFCFAILTSLASQMSNLSDLAVWEDQLENQLCLNQIVWQAWVAWAHCWSNHDLSSS